MTFILVLALILLSTKVAGDLSVRLGQPAVLGKLIVGIVLGPAVLGWVHNDEFIHTMSEIGVLLLMFIAGLETDLEQLRRNWKSAFAVAVGGVILPFFGSYSAALAFGFEIHHALFFGILFCATSVSISVQVLKDMDKLSSREGTTILGAAVVDDVLVVVLLAVLSSLLGTGGGGDVSIGWMMGKMGLFFVGALFAGWLIIPLLMKWMSKLKVTETVITAGLIACFGLAYFAESMGVAGIIGAFAAGIAVSLTPYKQDVEHKVEPIAYGIFVPVFFVSIGLNVSFAGIGSQLGFIIVVTLIAVLSKMIGGGLGARLTGFDHSSSLAIGAGMVSRGEVALIIAASGLQSGLLHPEYFTSVLIVVIVTTLITPPLLKILLQRSDRKHGGEGGTAQVSARK